MVARVEINRIDRALLDDSSPDLDLSLFCVSTIPFRPRPTTLNINHTPHTANLTDPSVIATQTHKPI